LVKKWNIVYFERIDSTQKYLLNEIKQGSIKPPVCVWSELQINGIGSRGNCWVGKEGNLFFSFADVMSEYETVPMQSLSIYFGWIFKKTLNDLGSKAVMKWPNDIYLIEEKPKKIGGIITNIVKNNIVCGIGLNTKYAPDEKFGSLDIEVKNDKILRKFFYSLQSYTWSDVICEYQKEFEITRTFFDIDGELEEDGSLKINQKKVYSKR